MTQDTSGKVTNSQLDTTNESLEGSPFPAADLKAHINRRAQRHNKDKTEKNTKDPQTKYRLKPKFTFRHVKKGIQEFHRSFVLAPAASFGVGVSRLVRFAGASGCVAGFNTRNKLLTQKLLKQGYWYCRLCMAFSKFYRRCCDLISRFWVGLESLLRQGLLEPDFCGDLVCGLGKIVDSGGFLSQFVEVVSHCGKVGCGVGVLRRTACLVVGPVAIGRFAFFFGCGPVGRASGSVMVLPWGLVC